MITSKDTVLITGGTGFTGTHLIKKLSETGCKLRVIARNAKKKSAFEGLDIEWFIGDVYEAELINKAIDNVHYIFHVAAAYREPQIDDQVYTQVHVTSTQLLAEAVQKQAQFKRFVHVSTVGVLGHISKPPADEQTEYNPGDVYQQTKTEAERWLLDYAQRTQLPIAIVRPAAIYGPGDKRLLKLFKMAKLPKVPIIGKSKGLYHLIHVEDLVDFMLYAATHEQAIGEVFICGSPSPISIKDMIGHIAECLGRKANYIHIPAWPVFLLADICEILCKPFNIEPPIYRRRVAFFTKDRAFSTKKMQAIGFNTKVEDKDGLSELCKWYQEQGWL